MHKHCDWCGANYLLMQEEPSDHNEGCPVRMEANRSMGEPNPYDLLQAIIYLKDYIVELKSDIEYLERRHEDHNHDEF